MRIMMGARHIALCTTYADVAGSRTDRIAVPELSFRCPQNLAGRRGKLLRDVST